MVAADHAGRVTAMTPTVANDGIDLADPVQARRYIADFKHIIGKEASYVTTNQGRLIHFRTMSDEDAVWVAHELQGWVNKARAGKPGVA
jgi:hypothetical protein